MDGLINAAEYYAPAAIPRSKSYADKAIESEGNVEMNGKGYYQRVYTDGCVELVRYEGKTKMWAILCFPSAENAIATAAH